MALLVALLIAGCGGGGGGGSTTDDTATPGVIVEAVPAAVTDLTATSSNDAIVLSFKVANPQNVTAFEAVCTGSGPTVTARSPSHGTATDTITVTGLTNPQSYTCTVSAINSSGASVASSPVQPTADPSTGNGTPDAPSALHMDAAPTSVVISFSEASVSGGSAVSSYVGICVGDKTAYSYAVASPITVLGLTEGVAYTCSVTAVNAQGLGTPSATSVVTPLAKAGATAGAPAAPTLSAVKGAPSSAVVEFNKTSVGASAAKRRSLGSATESGTLYHATCSKDDSVVSVESAGSPITVPQLVNGATYSCTVTATTTAGTSDPSNAMTVVPRTVPEAPTLTLVSAGDRIATLSFTAPVGSPGTPADGGSTITGYHATCTGGTQTATGDATSAGSVVVAGLVNDQQYTCSVAAVNAAGTGKASAGQPVTPVASTAPTGGTVANAPQDVRVITTDTTAVISFTPVTDSSLPVLDYTATCTSADSIVTATGTSSPITVSGLSYGVSYSCVVKARTQDGSGTPSEGQPAKPAGTVPAAPTLIDATPGDAAITLTFTANSDGGSAVTAFTGTCGDDKTGTAATSPVTVKGLSNGSIYACSVTATNQFGTGPSSGTKNARPRTVPQPPTAVQAKAGNTTITVTYTEPINKGGAEITGYTAWCQNGNNIFTAPSTAATDTSITVSGLSNDSEYTCWVTASNTAGPSVASDPTVKATPSAAVVEAPLYAATNLGKSAGDGTLTVTFDRPASNDASTTTYELICSPDGIDIGAGPASQVTAKGTNGTTYTCWIRAMLGSQHSDSGSVHVTPNVKPTEPSGITVTFGNANVTLGFSPNNGSGVTYSATCVAGDSFTANADGSLTVNGLTNGSTYANCGVTATNGSGDTATAKVSSFTLPAAPTKPIINSRTFGDNQVTLDFGPISSGVTYSATCVAGDSFTLLVSKLTITGLANGSTYNNCRVTGTNNVGGAKATSDAADVFTLPATPTKPVISLAAPGDTQIVLSFSPNAESNVDYTGRCNGGTSVNKGSDGKVTVTGLSNGKAYTCTVTALSSSNVAVTSDASTSVTPLSSATPTKPVISLAEPGDAQIVLSFSPNAESNVAYTGSCISGTSFNKGSDGKVTVTGLTNGTAYACTVTATNASNVSITSASTNATPLAPAALGAPTAGDGQVTLSFTKPSTNPSSTLYTASCATSETNWANGTTVGTGISGASPLKVTGLANGSVYVCGITASKGAGVSKAWVPIDLAVKATTPSITQAEPGDAQIVLSFSPNAESNVAYTGSCISGTSFNKGSDGKVTVTGLTNGTAYACKVTATNS
ncbi:beta strand repeat-containing protein, partial [Rhizobacter sp. P5_C2]